MPVVQALLVLMAACIVFAMLARRWKLPSAVVLVLGGMALAFIPGVPHPQLDPELVLAFFLPPLLLASANRTDWTAFRGSLWPILLMAVGAVLFTAACIAVAAKALVPDLSWAAAVALGAIVAPPDAVAAAAVLQRLRIPRRIVTVLEGESLVNDATALVLYRAAVATVVMGMLEWSPGDFFRVALGGIVAGWLVGRAAVLAMGRLHDTMLETAASFLACYGAFLAAEHMDASGVIAVVVTGLVFGRAQHRLSARTRSALHAVWSFIEFVLNSLIFILIGLQLNQILGRMEHIDPWRVAFIAGALALVLIASRFAWVFPVLGLPRIVPALRRRQPPPPWTHAAVISWAGMRGVVSLAAALALPLHFPHRDLIVFLAFTAILATLVLQGTTLEWLIRRLGVEERRSAGMGAGEATARSLLARAALQEMERRAEDPLAGAIARDLLPEYRDRLRLLDGIDQGAIAAERGARLELRLHALRAARDRLLLYRDAEGVEQDLLLRLTAELDLDEMRLRRLLGAAEG